MILLILILIPFLAFSKVYISSNYPLSGTNLEDVVNENNYMQVVQMLKSLDIVKDVSVIRINDNVELHVELYPIIEEVKIEGNLALWKATILNYLGIYEGQALKDVSSEDIENKLLRLYQNEGYLDAKVKVNIDVDKDGKARIHIHIHEGPAYFLRGGMYKGTTINPKELDKALNIVEGRIARQEELAQLVFKLQDVYIRKGYLDSFVYFESVKKERLNKPLWKVLLPYSGRGGFLSLSSAFFEGISNLFTRPISTLKALTGRGYVAIPVFEVIEGQKYEFYFNGAHFFKPEELLEATDLSYKGVDPLSLEEAKQKIEELYKSKGFFDVQVSYEWQGRRVEFSVKEGERYRAYMGDEYIGYYDEETLQERLNKEIDRLKNGGYTLAEGYVEKFVDKESKKVYIKFMIQKGTRQVIKAFVYEGDNKNIKKIFKKANSKLPAIYDTKLIEDLNLSIEKYFKEKGYMEGDYLPEVNIQTEGDTTYYTYIYKVSEGTRYKLGDDLFYGYNHTRLSELRYMTVRDTYYSENLDDETLETYYASGLFAGIKIDTFLDKDKKLVHRLIELQEDKRGYLDISLLYNTQEKLGIDLYVGWKNLFGIGLNSELSYRKTAKQEIYSLNFTDNAIFTRKLWFKSSIFKNYENHLSYDLTSEGISLSVGYRLTRRTSIGPVLSITTNRFSGQTLNLKKYGIFLLREYKDNPFSPKRLQYENISLIRAEGDTSYYKVDLRTFYLIPLKEGVDLDFKLEGGYASRNAPIFDRFFLGGLYNLRGYSYESVGQPNGGRYYLFGKLEFGLYVHGSFMIFPFVDVGQVGNRFPDVIKALKWDVGIGGGVKTPVGPLRVYVALPTDHMKRPKFYLAVGYYY